MSNSPVSDTLDPVIVVGDKEYVVKKFVTAKFLRATAIVTKLLESGDVVSLFNSDNQAFAANIIRRIPALLESSGPYVHKFCALVLTSNAELRRMEENDESVDNYLEKFAKDLEWDENFGVDGAVETIAVGIEQMGIQALRKNVVRLQNLFRQQ